MSSNLNRAVDDVKRLGKAWQGILELSAELEKLGSLEQARVERERALKDVEARVVLAEKLRVKAEANNERLAMEGEAVVQRAHSRAEEVVAQAAQEGTRHFQAAERQAASVDQQSGAARAALVALQAEQREAQQVLAALQVDVSAKRDELAQVEARIQQAKRSFQDLFK